MTCSVEGCECQMKAATLAAELEELKAGLARKQTSICSYCGLESFRDGRPEKEFQEEIYDHILVCDKRPERFLTAALYAVVAPFGINIEEIPKGNIGALVAAVQQRWKEEILVRDQQIDALLGAVNSVDSMLNALTPAE